MALIIRVHHISNGENDGDSNGHTLAPAFSGDEWVAFMMQVISQSGVFRQLTSEQPSNQPTANAVIEGLPEVKLTRQTAHRSEGCAVCQEDNFGENDESVTRLPCGHQFHRDCVVQWLENNNTCPTCRHELRAEEPAADPAVEEVVTPNAGTLAVTIRRTQLTERRRPQIDGDDLTDRPGEVEAENTEIASLSRRRPRSESTASDASTGSESGSPFMDSPESVDATEDQGAAVRRSKRRRTSRQSSDPVA